MAVYGILGDGECSTKFLTDTLDALYDKAELKKEDFWLMLPYDPKGNSDAVADVYDWVEQKGVWARAYSDGEPDEEIAVEEVKVIKRGSPAQSIVKDLTSEGGELLVILYTTNPDEPDDRDEESGINDAVRAANQNEVPVRQLNNGMMELDLTAEEAAEDEEGPDEEQVRAYGEAADGGDTDAVEALSALAEEYELDLEEEPYASMSWTDFAEALLTQDAEQANADVEPVEPEKQPQSYDRAELEKLQLRQLRSIALHEGWGKPGQSFPDWFLIDHIANGTVPSDEELDGTVTVPKTRPSGGKTRTPRAPKATTAADTNGSGNFLLDAAKALEAAGQALRNFVSQQ